MSLFELHYFSFFIGHALPIQFHAPWGRDPSLLSTSSIAITLDTEMRGATAGLCVHY